MFGSVKHDTVLVTISKHTRTRNNQTIYSVCIPNTGEMMESSDLPKLLRELERRTKRGEIA